MPRRPRIKLAGMPQHIVQRGINREPCFFAEEDYHFYLHWLEKSAADWHCPIHAYALMTNHVHLLVTPETGTGIAKLMQSIGRRYVHYINRSYRRTGSLWESRQKTTCSPACATSNSTLSAPQWCKTPANTAGAAIGITGWVRPIRVLRRTRYSLPLIGMAPKGKPPTETCSAANSMKKRWPTSGSPCHRGSTWGMAVLVIRFVQRRGSGVRRSDREDP
jgi:REP element-mobilizing transposase RayT